MYPGIPRATSGALIGLFGGFLFVTLLRAWIGIEPFWNTGLAMTMGIFAAAAGFIWGMGGFNPTMSEHADDSVPPPTPDEVAEKQGIMSVLGGTSWLMVFVSVAMMGGFMLAAYVPGLGLTITRDTNSSSRAFGTVPVELFGNEFMVNQVVFLLIWVAFVVISLAIAGALLMWVTTGLNGGVENAKAVEKTGTGLPRGLERALANQAGQLAERIAPKEDTETTAVVAKDQ
ncbi:MAG: hypothetical protein AAF125_11835 [Chloroflexota bacterium]